MADVIRMATTGDSAAIQRIYAPYVEQTPITFELEPPNVEEIAARIETILKTHPWLLLERDGVVAGYVYASPHRNRPAYVWSVDVSVYIDSAFHRRGIGRILYTELFAHLCKMGFYNAYAGITLPNAGSIGLHESMGFSLVGIFRNVGFKGDRWHDVGWWELQLQPLPEVPEKPRELIGC